ncbi:MAG TPA: hypothetical protein VHW93_11725, partial [Acidimicrobiales bacterium]|nr:hypothetical protein [Acidimicrobiales bacterium]
ATEVRDTARRWDDDGLAPTVHDAVTCCYAVQDKAWVSDPDGAPWEVYTVLADATGATAMGCSTETCGPSIPVSAVDRTGPAVPPAPCC